MRSGDDTRERIVEVAERLFAEHGVEQTSTRAITAAAGVNVAAVNYHFGGRDGLLLAVLDRTIGPLNARRLALLDAAVAEHGDSLGVDELLRAFLLADLEVLAELGAERAQLARFIGRCYAQPSPAVERLIRDQFAEVATRFYSLLTLALPDINFDELEFRMGLIVGVVVNLFERATAGTDGRLVGVEDPAEAVERLVAFLAPGLAAPFARPSVTAPT